MGKIINRYIEIAKNIPLPREDEQTKANDMVSGDCQAGVPDSSSGTEEITEDGWCVICRKGIETGQTICEECNREEKYKTSKSIIESYYGEDKLWLSKEEHVKEMKELKETCYKSCPHFDKVEFVFGK